MNHARAAALLLSASALGCGDSSRGPKFPTSSHFDVTRRAAPSFAPDLPAESTAEVSPQNIEGAGMYRAALPLDPEAARDIVTRFFIAVMAESSRDLMPLLAAQASVFSEGSRQSAQSVWRARFAQLDYTALSGRVVATPTTLHTYTYASVERARRDGVPVPSSAIEVVVVARPAQYWTGKARLFGEELSFKLRPKPDVPGFEIAEIVEDFRLP